VVRRYSRLEDVAALSGSGPAAASAAAPTVTPPGWLRTAAPQPATASSFIRPSESDDDSRGVKSGEAVEPRARALQRGSLVHRLLQSLPDVSREHRREAALRYLGRGAVDWREDEREALAAKVLALIDQPGFAPLFAPGSRAEVSIAGRLERPGRPPALVSGQIDRLVVTPDEILIVDYKTNHGPPRTAMQAPPAYLRQLALYRAVLTRLYPRLPIRAALLWTETAEMMEISAQALDARLADVLRGDQRP
jgi:ATP-dependent helicase/nuclease subunit A